MPDFTTIVSNTLPDVQMIAGDQQTFEYEVTNVDGTPIDLQYATCKVLIFRYGDPNYIFANLTGTVVQNGDYYNKFYVTFNGTTGSMGWSGIYQHQVRIIDAHSIQHIPAQGKLIVFPSPQISSGNQVQ
jgi:hypothetical protein